MKKPKGELIHLDTIRGYEKGRLLCLHGDCFREFEAELVKRKNALESVSCPHCRRNRIMFLSGDFEYVNISAFFGNYKRRKKKK